MLVAYGDGMILMIAYNGLDNNTQVKLYYEK
jgi:hypothetical protein